MSKQPEKDPQSILDYNNFEVKGQVKKERYSNMEFLRIVAMFMVMVLHADFQSLGVPDPKDYKLDFIASSTRTLFESLSIFSVNLFVAISGWFSINFSVKSILRIVLQYIYYGVIITTILYLYYDKPLDVNYFRIVLLLDDYLWFVKAYIGLMILSMPINYFCKEATKQQYQVFLSLFYLFQTCYGFTNGAPFIKAGYSTFSFIGIYLSARYCSLYLKEVNQRNATLLCVSLILINFFISNALLKAGSSISSVCFSYINPINIIVPVLIVIIFNKIDMGKNKVINLIGASSFGVYLLHQNPEFIPIFQDTSNQIFNDYSGVICLMVFFMFLCGLYLLTMVIDCPFQLIWTKVKSKLGDGK